VHGLALPDRWFKVPFGGAVGEVFEGQRRRGLAAKASLTASSARAGVRARPIDTDLPAAFEVGRSDSLTSGRVVENDAPQPPARIYFTFRCSSRNRNE
jgi:hypothetical protein